MAIGLTYSVPIVGYVPKDLKERAMRCAKQKKRQDHRYSASRFIEEAILEKLEREEGHPMDPHPNTHKSH